MLNTYTENNNNYNLYGFPRQKLSYKSKGKTWRGKHLDWANTIIGSSVDEIRISLDNKAINYDLISGILNEDDVQSVLNPTGIKMKQQKLDLKHYPIMNNIINVIVGEEWERDYSFDVMITNSDAVSEEEERKKAEFLMIIQEWIEAKHRDEEEAKKELEELHYRYSMSKQDIEEIKSSYLIKHYYRELDMKMMFNKGIIDVIAVNEEIYRCDVVNGEPFVERVDPNHLITLGMGDSNKIEDASVLIYWRYRSVSAITDDYYDVLTDKDVKYLDNLSFAQDKISNMTGYSGNAQFNYDRVLIDGGHAPYGDAVLHNQLNFQRVLEDNNISNIVNQRGDIREIKLYWKSKRKIKKVKKYNIEDGTYDYQMYNENYIINKDLGEEEEILYINEAWEATQIGDAIRINMRPRLIQYNRMSNPSLCHFGFIGNIYSIGGRTPYSLVDMMKPFSYLYNSIAHNTLDLIANNWGRLLELDLAKVPSRWSVEKWFSFAKNSKIAVTDSFKEGSKGMAKNKLVGNMNTATKGVIDLSLGNEIQQNIELMEYFKNAMGEFVGVTRQRLGQTATRETVGGIERATLQSNYITNWIYANHETLKDRVLDCFIDTAKVALRGRTKKFKYLISKDIFKYIELDGDQFASRDYGVVSDNTNEIKILKQKIEGLEQAMFQNGQLNASTLIKLHRTNSIAEMVNILERFERESEKRNQEAAEMERQLKQEEMERRQQMEERKLQIEEDNNIRDNLTQLQINENRNASNESITMAKVMQESYKNLDQNQDNALEERKRQFNEKIDLDKDKFEFDKKHKTKQLEIKEQRV